MKLSLKAGTTSKSVGLFIQDSSSTTGAGLTGLVFNSSSLTAYYVQPGSSAVAITLATLAAANSSWSSGGFKEIDSTNMPGCYRLDIPNAALTGATSVLIMLNGATNMAPCVLEIELTAWDNQDAVHGGLSCLPNTAVTTNASLITSGSGTDQLTVSGGVASSDAKKINAVPTSSVTTVNANVGTTQPVNFTGTGASALAKSDMVDIAGSAVATSSAQIGVNVVNFGGSAGTFASGIPAVNATQINSVSASSVSAINANLGTTQPVNFTGTSSSALVKSDTVDIAGSAVSTSSAQIGVNVVNFGGAAGTFTSGKPDVQNVAGNVTGSVGSVTARVTANSDQIGGVAVSLDANNRLKVDVDDWAGSAVGALPTNFSSLSINSSGYVTPTSNVKKNAATTGFMFTMTGETTHTPQTGMTVTAKRSIDGGAFALCTNAVSEVSNGVYKIDLAAADTNGDHIMLMFTAAGADQLNIEIVTQP